MSTKHVVVEGDCISSLAHRCGFIWETIWYHPDNEDLRQRRKDPNILNPGDIVVIPDRQLKQVPGDTEKKHRFKKMGEPVYLNLRLIDLNREPRANLDYRLDIDGAWHSGSTDDDGGIRVSIPPNARRAVLFIGDDADSEDYEEYEIDLGYVDPITETTGVQTRLRNLGLYQGAIDGDAGEVTHYGVTAFQEEMEQEKTGQSEDVGFDGSDLNSLHGT